MTYNFTDIMAQNSTLDLMKAINTELAGGIFWIFLLLSLFIIIYINMSFYHAKETFLFTSFFIAMIGGLMWLAGLIPFYIAMITLLLSVVGMILFFLTN